MAYAFGAWGVLPIVVPLFAYFALRVSGIAFPAGHGRISDRAVAGVVLAFASVVVAVRALSVAHAVAPGPLLATLVLATVAVTRFGPRAPLAFPAAGLDSGAALVLVVSAAGIALAVLAARWLPVWQWDSLGYHLPIVHFTLGARSVDGVPTALEYIGSYPHDVELFFVALRACLPDDRLVDLGQVPFGLGGAVVVAAMARRWNASVEVALAAGAAWLVVPAVFLQLPTDYVDVATATFLLSAIYFVRAPPSRRSVLLAGVALGLFVGSKPSAPAPAAILFTLLAVRAFKAGELPALAGSLVCVAVLGGESYVTNLVEHANPIWPVRVDFGPIHLPGEHPLGELLAAGANAQRLTGWLPWRVVRSLLSFTSMPVFDMRVGGFGPVVVCALPFAIAWHVQQRSLACWCGFACTLVSPDPAIARYVLAFPALVLAAATPSVARLSSGGQRALLMGVAILGAAQLVYAAPGLSGEGPPLWKYASLSDSDRAIAVGADGPPIVLAAARRRVAPGESLAFDENMDLSDLAWDLGQTYRVVFLERCAGPTCDDDLATELARDNVRVMVVGDEGPAAQWARSHPRAFERVSELRSCRRGTCSVFMRR